MDKEDKKLLLKELKSCCEYFKKEANWNKNSRGFGLIRDKSYGSPNVSSISAVGFGLASLTSAVNNDWISFDEAYQKANGTLNTLLNNIENQNGFYCHFINMQDCSREYNSEVSIIDSGLLIAGAITAGEFFGKEVKEKADKLYRKINWEWFVDKNKNMFYLGNNPEVGFFGNWDVYAEQLILYILSAGSPTYNIDKSLYDSIKKQRGSYKEYKDIIQSWFGSLFTYQYSHAFADFRNCEDENGINWHENSIKATLANRQYCIDNQNVYKTYGENSWGITACVFPNGYNGEAGAYPSSASFSNDGTIAPYGAISSIVFTPEYSIKALRNYYQNYPGLLGEYGLKSAFNLEGDSLWAPNEYMGIDKGITLMMIENYLSESIWKYFMSNEHVQKGFNKLKIKSIKR